MDKTSKFLHRLSKKDRAAFLEIFKKIETLSLRQQNVKGLKGMKGVYRLRKGKIRVIFVKQSGKSIILDIAHRKDIYKKP